MQYSDLLDFITCYHPENRYERTETWSEDSPFSIVTLSEFYGVSTDYLLGVSEIKNLPDTDLAGLHLSDDMMKLLASGKINNRLLCEIATHPDFQRLMVDTEICVDRIGPS